MQIIRKTPIPTAGVALGLAALGNLLQPYGEELHIICGVLSFTMIIMLLAKVIIYPKMIRDDLQNSILASVSATVFMTLMQLAGYIAPYAFGVGFVLWASALAAHLVLIVWFTASFIRRFKLHEVFPTYFIAYVGIVVASVTSPIFGMQNVGMVIFWFGFVCYMVLLVLVTYRYFKHEIPEAARPLFCIYAAPMSLSLAGYLSASDQINTTFVIVLAVLAQLLFFIVLTRLPKLMRLNFYPSFAAMTFPFVITAIALGKTLTYLALVGVAFSDLFALILIIETGLSAFMVAFVFAHYIRFFFKKLDAPQSSEVLAEEKADARFSENFED